MSFWYYKTCIVKTNDKVVTSVSEGKIIEIYNQGISQVIDAIQKLTVEIRTQKAEIETLSVLLFINIVAITYVTS